MKDMGSFEADKNDEHAFRVAYLVAKFVEHNLTQREEEELDAWIAASDKNQRLFEELTDPDKLDEFVAWKEKLQPEKALARLQSKLEFSDAPKKKPLVRSILPYVIAALFIGACAIALRWLPQKKADNTAGKLIVKDIAPGGNHATLELANGVKLLLDTTVNGRLATLENTTVQKVDSAAVSFKTTNPIVTPIEETYNMITTPTGGVYQLILSDGSKVVLNAQSSLRFPTAFVGKKRSVVLTGEAYFEVAKNPGLPFEVVTGANTITVLGTHFNVNAYGNEPSLKVTLAQGAVKLNNDQVLKPGEMGLINTSGKTSIVNADIEKELGWKNGLFVFKHTELDEIMRQVQRWYNCEVKTEAQITEHFNATVNRNLPVSSLLEYLEGTGRVHFRIENKTITILP